jgi:hypothetical protein
VVALVLVGLLVSSQIGTGVLSRTRVRGDHAFLTTLSDGPIRWNPCQPIHYEVNATDAPPTAMDDVREAVHRVSEATGIRFVEDGTTSRTVDQQVGAGFLSTLPGSPRYLPLLIDWVPHEHFLSMVDDPKAEAFGMPWPGHGNLAHEYVSGVVAMDAGGEVPSGFGERYSEGVVLMHELAHVMGLAHVASPHELMWSPEVAGSSSFPDVLQTDWGPGDLEGLRALGRDAGCLPARS